MAALTMPSYDQMMQPTLDALRALGGQATNQQIYEYVIDQLQLPREMTETVHKEGQKITEVEYRSQWTRTYLRRYGLIDRVSSGIWKLTESGQRNTNINPAIIVQTVRTQLVEERKLAEGHSSQDNPAFTAPQFREESIDSVDDSGLISPTPLFPTYSDVRYFLQSLDGVPYANYRDMNQEIWEQRGSPQEQVDWANPSEWIPERLTDKARDLAEQIYHQSKGQLNPRYSRGCWFFAMKHNLLWRDSADVLRITERGQKFIDTPAGELEVEIDVYEGVMVVLRLVAEKGPARRSDLLGEYAEYSRTQTTFRSDSVLKSSLYARLRNLIARTFVISRGQRYEITDIGLAYLRRNAQFSPSPGPDTVNKEQSDIHRLAKSLRDNARGQLHSHLLDINPFKFEFLVKHLLEEMGYSNVETTSPTNDKGVDVVAYIELGISSVREVIQVKRYRGNINRVALDQLRGSLHRFNAVRGTIITTGHFSKGAQEAAFERGAAPITLIDGEKLLDLLLENEIGVSKVTVHYFDFVPEKLVHLGVPDDPLNQVELSEK